MAAMTRGVQRRRASTSIAPEETVGARPYGWRAWNKGALPVGPVLIRLARPPDVPNLRELIERSARALSVGYYRDVQIESAIRYVFGVDSILISDGTYFV